MMDGLGGLDPHWFWLALGLFLAAAEIAVPGMFLIWLAGAAIATGLVTWAVPLAAPLQIVIFAGLSIVLVFAGRRFLSQHPVEPADPLMNQRGARLVGQTALLTQAIEGGVGRARLGDSEWLVHGADLPAGTRVRVSGSDGAILLVEPLDS